MPKSRRFTYTIVLFVCYLFVYYYLQHLSKGSTGSYMTVLDTSIPFMPEFVWMYHTLPVCIFMAMVLCIKKRFLFMRAFWSCVVASSIMSVIHFIAPAIYPHEAFAVTNAHEYLVDLTRKIDGPANTFPSGHVAFSWLMYLSVRKSKFANNYDYVSRTFLLWAIGISLSTLAIKQHFVADVVSGVVTAFISFHLAALFLRGKPSQHPIY